MTFTVDPFNEDAAIGEDGQLMGSVRILPIRADDAGAPTVEELRRAPILGYVGPDDFLVVPPID